MLIGAFSEGQPQWRACEFEAGANLVFQKAGVAEVQQLAVVDVQ